MESNQPIVIVGRELGKVVTKETVISTPQLVSNKDSIPKTQDKVDEQGEKQPIKRKRQKRKISYGEFLERDTSKDPTLLIHLKEWKGLTEPQTTINQKTTNKNIVKEDVSVPEVADQAAFSENQSCTKETVMSTPQPVIKNKSISEAQEPVEQQGEKKPFKCKRKKKTPIDWGNYYEQDKCNDEGTSAKNFGKEDLSMPEKKVDQAASSDKQSCTKETVMSAPQLVTENDTICETQETVEQQGEKKPFKCKRKKKTPIDWGNYYEQDNCNDQGTSAKNIGKETLPESEEADQAASSDKQSCTKETVMSTPQPVTKNESNCDTQETVEQQGEKKSKKKCKRKKETLTAQEVFIEPGIPLLENLTEVSDNQTSASTQEEGFTDVSDNQTPQIVQAENLTEVSHKETLACTQEENDTNVSNNQTPQIIQLENLTEVSHKQTLASTQEENFTDVTDNQTPQIVQVENLTKVSDSQTSASTQEETFTNVSDNQTTQIVQVENLTEVSHNQTSASTQEENFTDVTDNQTPQLVQSENLTEVSDNQTSASTQEESFTDVSDNQTPQIVQAENLTEVSHKQTLASTQEENFRDVTDNQTQQLVQSENLTEVSDKQTLAWTQEENDTNVSNNQTPQIVQLENLTEVSDNQTSASTQEESFTDVSDNQTPQIVQLENLTEVSDNQTSASTQEENVTNVSDNQTPQIVQAENLTEAYPKHSRNNRQRYWNQYPPQLYPQPYHIRPQWTPHASYENPQFCYDNMEERNFQRHHNSESPGPMPYPRPPTPPQPYLKHVNYLQQQLEILMQELWKNNITLSEQTERILRVEEKYNNCLAQLNRYEEALKDSKEIPCLSKSPEEQTNQTKCNCQAKFEEANVEVQEYLMKLLNEMFDINLQLNAKLNHQEDMLKRVVSEQRQDKNQMVSVQIQTDLQECSKLKTVHYQAVSTQTKMDVKETRCNLKPLHQTISTQTETDLLVIVEEEKVPETQQKRDEQWEKSLSNKSKRKNRRKASKETASEPEPLYDQEVSGENIKGHDVSRLELVEDQTASLKDEIYQNETVMSEPQQVTEEEKVPETQPNGDQQGEKKPSKKSKRKNRRKASVETASEPEPPNDQEVSGENYEQREVSILEIIEDQTASLKDEIYQNETVMSEPQQITEEENVPETQPNGDQQGEKKPSKKSKRKNRRKASMETASEPEPLYDQEVSGENIKGQDVSTPQLVEDQTASLKDEIYQNETEMSEPQQVNEEEKVPETQQNGDQQAEKKPSKKSKRKNRRKESMETASEPEPLIDQKVSGENYEQQEISILKMIECVLTSLKDEISENDTVISELQQITEEENIPETQQNGDQQAAKKPSKKSKRKNRRKESMETASDPEPLIDQKVSGENYEQQEVSLLEIIEGVLASIKDEISENDTVISELQQITEEENIPETKQNGDQQGEKKPSKKSKRKNRRKASMETASDPEPLIDQKVSGQNYEQQEVSILEIIEDQTASLKDEISENDTVISEPQQVTEEENIPETKQNGDQQGEKKPSKKSKRKNRRKASMETASDPEPLIDQKVSGQNYEQQEVSILEIIEDQTASLKDEISENDTVISEPQQVTEEENIPETKQNGDQQGETKPSKKSKRKNRRKASMETASDPEPLIDQKVSVENYEQQEVSILEIIEDQTASLKDEISENDTVISEPQQVTEEENIPETKQNGDQQGEKKPSKKSKRKNRRKASMETASDLEPLIAQKVSGQNYEQQEVSILEIIEDQTASLKDEISENDTVISEPQQVTEEENIPETQQNGDQQGEKKPSKKSKRKNRRKASMETASDPEPLIDQKVSVENYEQQEVSILEIIEDQTASLKDEIYQNDTVISEPQQVTEEENIPETQQNGDQQGEKKPSKKSKRKNRIKKQTVLETETESPQTGFDQSETNLKVSEEEEISPPQTKYKVMEDVIPTPPQGLETQVAKELHVQDNSCEQEDNSSEQKESPVKKVSLWRRLKKQLTPSHRRQYKDKQENRPE